MSYSTTASGTFNRSHARKVATKVAGDLKRLQQQYGGWPSDTRIELLIEEITEMLALDYMDTLEIGYGRDGERVLSLRYKSRRDGTLTGDDNAGGLARNVDISGCVRINYMTYTDKYYALSATELEALRSRLPYTRTGAPAPVDGSGGYWTQDRTYSAAGGGTERSTYKPFGS